MIEYDSNYSITTMHTGLTAQNKNNFLTNDSTFITNTLTDILPMQLSAAVQYKVYRLVQALSAIQDIQ